MLTGHTSHQIRLDADIWLTPMPHRRFTRQEREEVTAASMLRDPFNVDLGRWTPIRTRLIKLAASYPAAERLFVHPAIKQVLCDQAGKDRAWLRKVRPWWGHHYHFHIRLACPSGNRDCRSQAPVSRGDGCGAELDEWFMRLRAVDAQAARKPTPSGPSLAIADLPVECRSVIALGGEAARRPRSMAFDNPAGPPPPRPQSDGKPTATFDWQD